MKTKLFISSLLAMAMTLLVSCASQDNGNTKQAEQTEKVSVDKIYDGYEALQGKKYGNSFTMPEKITPVKPDGLYSFTCKPKSGLDDEQESKHYFRSMVGDSYDESCFHKERDNVYSYIGKDGFTMYFANGCPINAYINGTVLAGSNVLEDLGEYDPAEDEDISLELKNGTYTIGEICSDLTELISKAFYPLYEGFEMYPYHVTYILDNNMEKVAEITYGVKYKGLSLEVQFSPLFEIEQRNGYQIVTNYSPSHMLFDVDTKGSTRFFTSRFAPRDLETTEVHEIISLQGAVDILKDNLAENSNYKFTDVKLYYCCKEYGPTATDNEELNSRMNEDFKDAPLPEFEPTWVFYWNAEDKRYDVKVNAVTGEITVEAR